MSPEELFEVIADFGPLLVEQYDEAPIEVQSFTLTHSGEQISDE